MAKRMWQQVRLWAYVSIGYAAVFYIMYGTKPALAALPVFLISCGLAYFERCGVCRKLVWRERGNVLGPLWIGRTCREKTGSAADTASKD